MKTYLNVVICAIEHNNKYLVIENPASHYSAGLLSFPGGKVDLIDESSPYDILRAAAMREVFEEVGLKLSDPIEYVFSSFFVGKNNTPIINSTFYCKLSKTTPILTPSSREVAGFAWMSAQEIKDATTAPDWLKEYIEKIEAYKATKKLT